MNDWKHTPSFIDVCSVLEKHCIGVRHLDLLLPVLYNPATIDIASKQVLIDRLTEVQYCILQKQSNLRVKVQIRIIKVKRTKTTLGPAPSPDKSRAAEFLLGDFRAKGWRDMHATCDRLWGFRC
jgi:hypothetical protein